MKAREQVQTSWFSALALLFGIAASVCWLGFNAWALTHGRPLPGGFWGLYAVFLLPLSPAVAAGGLWWGLRALRRGAPLGRRIAVAIATILFLSPVLAYGAMVLLLGGYVLFSNYAMPEEIAKSSVSPDGRHTAFLLRKQTIGESVYPCCLSVDGGKRIQLPEMTPMIKAFDIHWAPDSSVVVFEKQLSLIAVRIRDCKSKEIPLEPKVAPDGSSSGSLLRSVDFPRPGVVVARYDNAALNQTVDVASQ